jgi:hypothetical protein
MQNMNVKKKEALEAILASAYEKTKRNRKDRYDRKKDTRSDANARQS